MPSEQAEAGQAGRLESLRIVDLNNLGIYGNGVIGIDDGGTVPTINWYSKRHPSHGHGRNDSTVLLPQGFDNAADVSSGPSKEREFEKSPARERRDFDSYRSRIEYLRSEAVHDGCELNRDSETSFKEFVLSTFDLRKGSLVLMDNGNIRAIWKDAQGFRLGLQFLGGGVIQYVIFRRRKAGQQISRVAGRDSPEGVLRQIDAFDLGMLLYE